MSAPLDELYFTWLYSQVGSVRLKNRSRSYWGLLRQLYTKEFVWLIPNDDNRVEDGKDLRYEFLTFEGIDADPHWMDLECNVFEMLVALSRRLAFEAEGQPRRWFWHLMENLELREYNDEVYSDICPQEVIDHKLETLIFRNYHPDGRGGLFPLRHPMEDQRGVEIWYQLNAYLLERE